MSPFSQSFAQTQTTSFSLRSFLQEHLLFFNILFLGFLLVLVFASIIQVTQMTASGYDIHQLENEIRDLTIRNQQLEVTVRRAQSLEHAARAVKMMGFVEGTAPVYIERDPSLYAFSNTHH